MYNRDEISLYRRQVTMNILLIVEEDGVHFIMRFIVTGCFVRAEQAGIDEGFKTFTIQLRASPS